jgi:hypothetical protein
MNQPERPVVFRKREFKGSRYRCLLATAGAKAPVVEFLNTLVPPTVTVADDAKYQPAGFAKPEEGRLGETNGFLEGHERDELSRWWLAFPESANTPNWDMLSTCTVDGRRGLLLVEAKAHEGELKTNDCCGAKNKANRDQIAAAIKNANSDLGQGWNLTCDSHYQLANRFAWASKVASLGVPVVLVYLGFLNAHDMPKPFADACAWERAVLNYSRNVVPARVWGSMSLRINGTPLIPLIRSAEVKVQLSTSLCNR